MIQSHPLLTEKTAKITEPNVTMRVPAIIGTVLNCPSEGNQDLSKMNAVLCPLKATILSLPIKRKIRNTAKKEK